LWFAPPDGVGYSFDVKPEVCRAETISPLMKTYCATLEPGEAVGLLLQPGLARYLAVYVSQAQAVTEFQTGQLERTTEAWRLSLQASEASGSAMAERLRDQWPWWMPASLGLAVGVAGGLVFGVLAVGGAL
jgi:hypothetical protein